MRCSPDHTHVGKNAGRDFQHVVSHGGVGIWNPRRNFDICMSSISNQKPDLNAQSKLSGCQATLPVLSEE